MPRHNKKKKTFPKVSILTPTFNRRPFIPYLIKCIEAQTYPKHCIEWIIVDDGTDKIGDLVEHLPYVRYFPYDEKMTLGKKRNLMNSKAEHDIIVYMDDDDYYPPERVAHSVETLQKHPEALCAGSSEIYIYFKHVDQIYKFGPYGKTHATAGTFAFRRELLKQTAYEEDAALAEEKHFLKNYTIPLVQMDPMKTILVFSHPHNTFDKRDLLVNANEKIVKQSSLKVSNFIKNPEIREFYVNGVESALLNYDAGNVKHKPDVVKQTVEIKEKREKMKEAAIIDEQKKQMTSIVLTQNGQQKQMSVYDCAEFMRQQQESLQRLRVLYEKSIGRIKDLEALVAKYEPKIIEL
jgi:glycosyltransferase involved in cell wall biosynthesis